MCKTHFDPAVVAVLLHKFILQVVLDEIAFLALELRAGYCWLME
jgi:hypothetical protein